MVLRCIFFVQVGDDVGWIASHSLQEIDPQTPGRQQHRVSEDANPRTWDSKKVRARSWVMYNVSSLRVVSLVYVG